MRFRGKISLGTAFQIGPREILTCAHNLYHRGYEEEAEAVSYVPAANGMVDLEALEGIRVSSFSYPSEYKNCKYEEKTKYEYAYGVLEKECDAEVYFEWDRPNKKLEGTKIEICGYPSTKIDYTYN